MEKQLAQAGEQQKAAEQAAQQRDVQPRGDPCGDRRSHAAAQCGREHDIPADQPVANMKEQRAGSRRQTWLFVLVTAAFFAIVGVLIWKKVLQKKFELVCLAMIAGGALGNLIDRVVSGAVTDMIRLEFVNFPVFNVADCFVTTGCALLIVYVLFFDRPKKTPPEQDGKAE